MLDKILILHMFSTVFKFVCKNTIETYRHSINNNKHSLTKDEKLRRAIFFYTYNMLDFEIEYINGVYEED